MLNVCCSNPSLQWSQEWGDRSGKGQNGKCLPKPSQGVWPMKLRGSGKERMVDNLRGTLTQTHTQAQHQCTYNKNKLFLERTCSQWHMGILVRHDSIYCVNSNWDLFTTQELWTVGKLISGEKSLKCSIRQSEFVMEIFKSTKKKKGLFCAMC